MSKYETIVLEMDESNHLAILYLNRPKQLNALIYKLAEEICMALEEISNNNSIRCVIITGKGKAFCSGGDLFEFEKETNLDEYMSKLASKFHEGLKRLKNLKLTSIAAVNGACFGAGLGLACACDLRVCAEIAKFGSAFTSVGLSPDSSLTFHLPKIVGLSLANEMILLNKILDSKEALEFKLVSRIINTEDSFLSEIKKLGVKLANGPPLALERAKKLLMTSYSNDLETQLDEEAESIIKSASTEDCQEGLRAFMEKRDPNFKGK